MDKAEIEKIANVMSDEEIKLNCITLDFCNDLDEEKEAKNETVNQ